MAFAAEVDPGASTTVRMPNGTASTPFPASGSAIEFFVSGSAGTSTVNWSSGPITWFGGAPTATDLGWYRFVFTGGGFMGEHLGAIYT